jgi:hypothetical protein
MVSSFIYLTNLAGLATYNPDLTIFLMTTVPPPSRVCDTMLMLSMIVEFMPITLSEPTVTKPAIATLGDKKQCRSINESCAIVQPIFTIVFSAIIQFASILQQG